MKNGSAFRLLFLPSSLFVNAVEICRFGSTVYLCVFVIRAIGISAWATMQIKEEEEEGIADH